MSTQLQVLETVKGTALEQYADRAVLRELTNRLLNYHPAAKEVGETGMLMAAQLAVLMGASPLPGTNEIHIYKDNKGVQVVPGINYWQRRGDQKGGVLWDIEPRPMSEAERDLYQIDKTFHAAICRGIRMADVIELRGIGLSLDLIVRMRGVTGIGVAGRNEYAKNGRPPIWTAIKRAKTDFFKAAFPFIPGEKIEPGTGLSRSADGTIRPDYSDPHWGAQLSWEAQEEHEPSEFAQRLASMPKAQFDAEIFGSGIVVESITQPPAVDVVDAEYTAVSDEYADINLDEPKDGGPLPDDEQVIAETPQADFLKVATALISRYPNVHALKSALKKIGYTTVSKDVTARLEMYRAIRDYAAQRDAEEAMSEEE